MKSICVPITLGLLFLGAMSFGGEKPPSVSALIEDLRSGRITVPSYEEGLSMGLFVDSSCGNIDCDDEGKHNLADVTAFIFYLISNQYSIPPPMSAADIDWCGSINLADLSVLFKEVYDPPTSGFCDGNVNCEFAPSGDTVALVVDHWPTESWPWLKLDLYCRNTQQLHAASMGISWDNPNLILDSAVTHVPYDTFGLGLVDGSVAQSNTNQRFQYQGFVNYASTGIMPGRGIWASWYFHLSSWNPGDSIVFDTFQYTDGTEYLFCRPPGTTELAYRPVWRGPLVVPFVEEGTGDFDGSGGLPDIVDVMNFVDYLFQSGEGPTYSPMADLDRCDDIDVTDLRYLVDFMFGTGPPPGEIQANCDYHPDNDTIRIQYVEGTNDLRWMDLFGRNTHRLMAVSMGFTWDNPGLRLDSVYTPPFIDMAFDNGPFFFEDNDLETSNLNRRFRFSGCVVDSGNGIGIDSTKSRLWARYYFTLLDKSMQDSTDIDTGSFDDGSQYEVSPDDTSGYDPNWHDAGGLPGCCGIYTDGLTGNVDCDADGKRNLADITKLVTRVYLEPPPPDGDGPFLCCEANGNTNGDLEGRIGLSDITDLISRVYTNPEIETADCP